MEKLEILTGLKTFNVNDSCEITFNPADVAFLEVIGNTMDAIETKWHQYNANAKVMEPKEIFATARTLDSEIREEINSIFGVPVCDMVFGKTSMLALAGGLPLFMNLMLAIIDVMDVSITEEEKQSNPRLQHYINKYKNKRK